MKELIFSIEHYMRSGGIVMIPILTVSFFMWLLIINRMLFLRRLYIKNISRDRAGELVKKKPGTRSKVPGCQFPSGQRIFISQKP